MQQKKKRLRRNFVKIVPIRSAFHDVVIRIQNHKEYAKWYELEAREIDSWYTVDDLPF